MLLSASYAMRGDTSSETQPSTPWVRSQIGQKRSAATRRSSSASSKKVSSSPSPRAAASAMPASYALVEAKAWSKIVGFDVSPVIPSSSM
jgi:hypothetical protein